MHRRAGSEGSAQPRTAGYPIVTSAFQEAFAAIRDGANVQGALDRTVETIDRDRVANQDYGL